jgi:hypothetical protein
LRLIHYCVGCAGRHISPAGDFAKASQSIFSTRRTSDGHRIFN